MRTRRLGTGALAALVLALTLAACGSSGGGNQVASLGGDDARTTADDGGSSDDAEKDPEDAFREFAECMREHGVDMPDPEVSDDGGVSFSAPEGAAPADGAEVRGSDEFASAHEACEQHLEGVVNGDGKRPNEEQQEKFREQALEHAQCMRDHGIDFPDPQFGDGGMVTQSLGGGIDPNDPTFQDAMEECSEKAGLPKPGKGGEVVGGTRVSGK
jgi:hypothetical protein